MADGLQVSNPAYTPTTSGTYVAFGFKATHISITAGSIQSYVNLGSTSVTGASTSAGFVITPWTTGGGTLVLSSVVPHGGFVGFSVMSTAATTIAYGAWRF